MTFCTSTNLTRSDFEITLYDCMRFYSGIWFTLGSAMARAMYTDKGLRSDRPKQSTGQTTRGGFKWEPQIGFENGKKALIAPDTPGTVSINTTWFRMTIGTRNTHGQ